MAASRGAKSKYSPTVVELVCEALRAGMTQRRAALLAGISEETYFTWLREKPQFSEACKRAEAECQAANLAIIRAAATDGTWQASAWILERRFPTEFGRQVVEEHGEHRLIVEIREAANWRRQGVADVASDGESR